MNAREKQGWLIVGVLFVSWFIVWGGGLNTASVFYPPLLKSFGWSRAKLSLGFAFGALSAGVTGPLIGWLCDRFDVRKVMVSGVALTFISYLALSRMQTYPQFVFINLAVGIGVVACTGIPSSIVVANWFNERRGLAMGISLAGASIGGALMTPVASHVIGASGWRVGYVVLAVPMAAIVIPLLIGFLKGRPDVQPLAVTETAPAPIELPGLEVREAFAERSIWLITLVQFLGASLWAGLGQHFIAYMIGIGYSATYAASALAVIFLFTTAGSLFSGPLADRINARRALAITWIGTAIAMVALLGATHFVALAIYVVLAGVFSGALGVLMPLLMLESLGVKRLGSLMGLSGVFSTLGFAAGPIVTGRIFDLTGSYTGALWMFAVVSGVCVVAVLACRPYEPSESTVSKAPAAA
jgi:MFS family permease